MVSVERQFSLWILKPGIFMFFKTTPYFSKFLWHLTHSSLGEGYVIALNNATMYDKGHPGCGAAGNMSQALTMVGSLKFKIFPYF